MTIDACRRSETSSEFRFEENKAIKLGQAEIMDIIPHRPPALLIDRAEITFLDGNCGSAIKAEYFVDPGHPILEGHYPQKPVFRGVDMVEAAAQACAVLGKQLFPEIKGLPYMEGLGEVTFLHMARPGQTITIKASYITFEETTMGPLIQTRYHFTAEVFLQEKKLAHIGKLVGITARRERRKNKPSRLSNSES